MKNYVNNISAFAGRYFFFLILLVLILCRLVMVIPVFPKEDLDPSWVFSLGTATSNHFIFGKDIIHNFGPLSMIFTGLWTPEHHVLTIVLSIIFALSLCFFIYKIFENSGYFIQLLLVLFFFINVSNIRQDFFFEIFPVLASLLLISSYSCERAYSAKILLLGFNAALLLLVKMSFGTESFLCLLLLFVFYLIKKDWQYCIVLLVGFTISFVFLYVVSGQRLSGIIYYPLNVLHSVSGYTDAMSIMKPASSIRPVFTAAVFFILFLSYLTWRSLRPFDIQKLFSVGVFVLVTLVVFKHAFIRNAYGHGLTADAYLYQCFLLIYLLHSLHKSIAKNILITVGVISLLVLGSENYGYFFNGARVKSSYACLISHAANIDRLFSETKNRIDYDNSIRKIRNLSSIPVLQGTSDIYNFNQSLLLVSDNDWNPRPAFQSYQAVNSYTIQANYDHLISKDKSPDNIFFRVETLDWRIPALDDGLSWKALLGLYKPVGWTDKKDYLILKRDSSGKVLSVNDTKSIEGKIGHEIVNPYENGLVFLKLHIRKSLAGALVSVVYKPEPVWIKLKLQNGQEKTFRIIPSMSETGFLLSPLTQSTADFMSLYKAGYFPEDDIGMRVRSVTILPESPYQYSDSIDVTFEQLDPPERSKFIVQQPIRISPDVKSIRNDPSVKFYVDKLTYRFSNDRKMLLGVRGWAFRKDVDIQNSSYSLIFAGQEGDSFEIPLANTKRDDVTRFFKDGRNYDLSGFQADDVFIDVSELKGKAEYKVYLRMIINGVDQIIPLGKTVNVG